MKRMLIAIGVAVLLLPGCAKEKEDTATVGTTTTAPAVAAPESPVAPTTAETSAESAAAENTEVGTWAGQVKVSDPVSTVNYVGAESGDWVPMRFRNESEVGRKILAACGNDDNCEFTGAIEFLDEAPPTDASALAQIVRVDSVKRLPPQAQ
jgi:hypothetical protein